MLWYSDIHTFILLCWVSVSTSVARIAKLFVARVQRVINTAPLIKLPVTSPTPPTSHIAVACGHAQCFIATLFAGVHNLARRIRYIIVWHIPMYMRPIAKSLHCLRVAVLNFLASGLLCLATAIHDPAVWNTKNDDVESPNILIHIRNSVSNDPSSSISSDVPPWKGYQNFSSNAGPRYAPLSNASAVNLDQTAVSIFNDASVDAIRTPASGITLSSDSNWGLTPSDSFLCSDSASSQSSLTTPSQSPDQAFFNNLTLACKSTDNLNMDMDITEGDMDIGISLAPIMEERDRLKAKLSAKGLESSSASINSFGQIERLFEDNYGKPASLTADEFCSSFGNQFIAPAPISVFSASVYYDASSRSSLNVRLNALVSGNNSANSSFDVVCQNNTVMEEDITTAMGSADDHRLGSSLGSNVYSIILEDVSSPESDMSTFELSAACSAQDNLMEEDVSIISVMNSPVDSLQSAVLSPHQSILSAAESPIDVFSSRNSLDLSSVILSPQDSILSQESLDPSSEPSSVQTSAVSSPLYNPLSSDIAEADGLAYLLPNPSQGLSDAQTLPSKKANRRARMTSGLAIDINTLSPSIITSASPLINSELSPPTPSSFSIPSIVVSPVSEDTSSLASSSPEFAVATFTEQKNIIPGEVQLLDGANRPGFEPISEYKAPVQASHSTQNTYIYPSHCFPSRAASASRDSGSRRVGLRGSLPRYRFSTLSNESTASASAPADSRSLTYMPSTDRRVGLLGTAPRQRFAPTFAPSTSAVALLARAAHEERERAAVIERHRARAQFFAQRDAAHGHGLRPLLLPLSVAARAGNIPGGVSGRSASPARFWGVPF